MKLDLPYGGKFARLDNKALVSGRDPHRNLLSLLLKDNKIKDIDSRLMKELHDRLINKYGDRLDLGLLMPTFGNQVKIYGESSEINLPLEADKPKIRAVTLNVLQAEYTENTFTL